MTTLSPQLGRALTRPWSTATVLASLFVALHGVGGLLDLLIFFANPGMDFGGGSARWEILRSEWMIYALYLLVGLIAAYILRLVVLSGSTDAWPRLVLRAAILFYPLSIVITFVVSLIWGLIHSESFHFLGFQILG